MIEDTLPQIESVLYADKRLGSDPISLHLKVLRKLSRDLRAHIAYVARAEKKSTIPQPTSFFVGKFEEGQEEDLEG